MRLIFPSRTPSMQSTKQTLKSISIRDLDPLLKRHSGATILLHWGTVVVILVAVVAIYMREVTEDKWMRQMLLDVHRQLGVLVLMGLLLRIAVRYAVGLADHSSQMPAILRWAAWLTHIALYIMLAGIPLMGWAASNAHSVNVNLLGIISLPNLAVADADLAETLDDYHKWMAWALGGLVLMHAAAALWHHYSRKDAVLLAMLPQRRR